VPELPDTCFCDHCLARFAEECHVELAPASTPERARTLLAPGSLHADSARWRRSVFTDRVREFRAIRNGVPPRALLGAFHGPSSEDDFAGASRTKLAIDLKAQAKYADVFSPMPYHARFGQAADPAWIVRQVSWLGRTLGVEDRPGQRTIIWPIVQLADWGEPVPGTQVAELVDQGVRLPATGPMDFTWGGLARDWDKVERLGQVYRALGASDASQGSLEEVRHEHHFNAN
jgi:hypothetical protein